MQSSITTSSLNILKLKKNLFLKKYLTIYLVILLISALFLLSLKKIYCFDIWWHLATGKLIYQKHIIPKQDYFSYTFYGKPWIDSLWLFQLIIYFIYKIGGFTGLILFKLIIITTAIIFLYKTLRLNNVEKNLSLIITLLVILGASIRFNVRPHLMAFLYVSITWYSLLRIKLARDIRNLWFIILIITYLIWVNTHGSFIIGLGLCSFFLLEIILKYRNLQIKETAKKKDFKIFVLIFFWLTLFTFINPYGWRLIHFVLFSHTKNDATKFILEWLPLTKKDILSLYLNKILFIKILVLIILGSFIQKNIFVKRKEHLIWIFWTLSLSILAIKHSRFLGILGFGCAPILGIIYERENKFLASSKFFSLILISIFLLMYAKNTLKTTNLGFGVQWENYPYDIVQFIKKENLKGPIFNDYGIGGFLIWNLYPKYLVFIDGRTPSLYSPYFYWQYRMFLEYPEKIYKKIYETYKIRTIITSNKKVVKFLKRKSYKILGFDDNFFILTTGKNKNFYLKIYDPSEDFNTLKKKLKKEELKKLQIELVYVQKNFPHSIKALNLLGSLYIDKDPKLAIRYFKKALKKQPHNYNLMINIALAYYNEKNYRKSYYFFKRALYLKKDDKILKYLPRTCYKLKKFKEGYKYIKKYFNKKKDSDDPRDYEYMGLLLYENNKFERAIDYFKRALFLENDKQKKSNLLYNIGNCYFALNQNREAERYYKRALKLNPNNKLASEALRKIK